MLDILVSYLILTLLSYNICILSTLQIINHRYNGITVTISAMAADTCELTFAKNYLVIMPLLSNIVRNAKNEKREYQFLKIKAMEYASLIDNYSLFLSLNHTHSQL